MNLERLGLNDVGQNKRAISKVTWMWLDWVRHATIWAWLVLVPWSTVAQQPELANCQGLFLSGNYTECAELAAKSIEGGQRGEDWFGWQARAFLVLGRIPEARAVVEAGLARNSMSVRLRLIGHEVFRRSGDPARAALLLREINELAGRMSWRYNDPVDRVALGRAALLLGADPRQVLELFFDRVKKERPNLRDVHLATGELALSKYDYRIAAESFQEGLKHFPDDPDLLFGLARSFAPSEPKQASEALTRTLELNPHHVPALLFHADHLIDSELYDAAAQVLDTVQSISPTNPDSWSYRAVLAHLRGDTEAETAARDLALGSWKHNPEVDHRIGQKLSQKYRFEQGAVHQRQALRFDANFWPAKIQLAQDLLRLGQVDEAWQLAEDVHQHDRYDVAAYNLVTLRDNLSKFRTLGDGPLTVRMEPREADLYGDRVVALLSKARQTLCDKYGLELNDPVSVEIFPQASDFAVRTFGMPGGAGFLGVCFGKVVTAKSPAAHSASPTSWESVLWHEFCHVVTLQLTANKMPRWLSEGISVYEERQADPRWGQRMDPRYREMILGDDLTPVGKLSAAFLAPPSDRHLQFAYFESSLVVEFLIEQHGLDAFRAILVDLARDVPINQAIENHASLPIQEIEAEFEKFARARAEALAPDADLEKHSIPTNDTARAEALAEWTNQHPSHFWGLLEYADALVKARRWSDAKKPLARAIKLLPSYVGPDNPYLTLARVHRELNEIPEELAALERLTALDADQVGALLRLIELNAAAKDWPRLARDSEQLLELNPLLAQPHRSLAEAAESLGRTRDAIAAYRRVLLLDPEDPAEVHFRLGQLLHQTGDPSAKRHVLSSLEYAPRFAAALRLLLQIDREQREAKTQ